jgi:hypothetical protein
MPHYIDFKNGYAINVETLLTRLFIRARNDEDTLLASDSGTQLSSNEKEILYRKSPTIKEIINLLRIAQQCHLTVHDKLKDLSHNLSMPDSDAKIYISEFRRHFRTLTDSEQVTIGKYKVGHAIASVFESSRTLNQVLDECEAGKLKKEEAAKIIAKIANQHEGDLDDTEFLTLDSYDKAEDLAQQLRAEMTNKHRMKHS